MTAKSNDCTKNLRKRLPSPLVEFQRDVKSNKKAEQHSAQSPSSCRQNSNLFFFFFFLYCVRQCGGVSAVRQLSFVSVTLVELV